jgi:hypothetical protein
MTFRNIRLLAVIWAVAAALLLLSDLVVRDRALALAGSGLLAGLVVLAILTMLPSQTQSEDAWAKIAWGKFFVAIIYASMAVACLVAMVHTPDAARLIHEVRAVL